MAKRDEQEKPKLDSKKILIIIGDGGWDDETGRDRRSKHDVLKQAHQTYDYIFTIVCKFFFVDLGA